MQKRYEDVKFQDTNELYPTQLSKMDQKYKYKASGIAASKDPGVHHNSLHTYSPEERKPYMGSSIDLTQPKYYNFKVRNRSSDRHTEAKTQHS